SERAMTRLPAAVALVSCLSLIGGCSTTTTSGSVGADRSQFMLASSQDLNQSAAAAYNKLKAEAAAKGALNTDGALLQRVRAIAARLEPQTRIFRADAPGWAWEVNVINSSQLNAFCMPGGKIMVYSGLVNQLRLTDDEL